MWWASSIMCFYQCCVSNSAPNHTTSSYWCKYNIWYHTSYIPHRTAIYLRHYIYLYKGTMRPVQHIQTREEYKGWFQRPDTQSQTIHFCFPFDLQPLPSRRNLNMYRLKLKQPRPWREPDQDHQEYHQSSRYQYSNDFVQWRKDRIYYEYEHCVISKAYHYSINTDKTLTPYQVGSRHYSIALHSIANELSRQGEWPGNVHHRH